MKIWDRDDKLTNLLGWGLGGGNCFWCVWFLFLFFKVTNLFPSTSNVENY